MQTFLLSTSFEQSAKWLDTRRLGKQRVECLQILTALTNPDYGWQNHPAVKMWRGYEWPLLMYGLEICEEWTNRGYKDTCAEKMGNLLADTEIVSLAVTPEWLTEDFASNHRSILLGKALESYRHMQARWLEVVWGNVPEGKRFHRKLENATKTLSWYQSLNWTEQPAQRVIIDGKLRWPYTWGEQ